MKARTTDRGILFQDDMALAVLLGKKTQTRRLRGLKGIPADFLEGDVAAVHHRGHQRWGISRIARDGRRSFWPEDKVLKNGSTVVGVTCPFGLPGDTLWVREVWRPVMEAWRSSIEYRADVCRGDVATWAKKAPSRDAFESCSTIALRFPGGRSHPKHSEAWHSSMVMPKWASRCSITLTSTRLERLQDISEGDAVAEGFANRERFAKRIDEINGAGTFDRNPWVWVMQWDAVPQPPKHMPIGAMTTKGAF